MASSVKEFGAHDANGQQPGDGHASPGAKRAASGSTSGEWLVNVSGDVVVPMTASEIVDGLRAGKLSERSLVWRIGMHDWTVLGDVPQLRMAAGSASASLPPPPSSTRVSPAPSTVQAESQRRRNTLPLGFPAVRDPASVQQPHGLSLPSPLSTPVSAGRRSAPPKVEEEVEALAVYDRPAASLTFSDSVRAEWQGEARLVTQSAAPPPKPLLRRLTPVPAVASRLPQSTRSNYPHSLVPITAEAENPPPSRTPGAWGDLSVVLAADFRAAKASSKRKVLWAALGSAALASAFTVWLVHTPAPTVATSSLPPAHVASQPVLAPPAAPTLAALPSLPRAAPVALTKPVARAPKAAPRPRAKPVLETPAAASEPPSSDNPYGVAEPSEPRTSATSTAPSVAPSDAPAPSAEASPAPAAAPAPVPSSPSGL